MSTEQIEYETGTSEKWWKSKFPSTRPGQWFGGGVDALLNKHKRVIESVLCCHSGASGMTKQSLDDGVVGGWMVAAKRTKSVESELLNLHTISGVCKTFCSFIRSSSSSTICHHPVMVLPKGEWLCFRSTFPFFFWPKKHYLKVLSLLSL